MEKCENSHENQVKNVNGMPEVIARGCVNAICTYNELMEKYTAVCKERDELRKEQKMIKDSGDRTEFDTGAVRDMRRGKGRCDLIPIEVTFGLFHERAKNEMWSDLTEYKKSGYKSDLYSALIGFAKYVYGSWETMLLEVAIHFEEGAEKYGENNWQKGIPEWCYFDSAIRHFLKWSRGDEDERHDRAFVWNVLCLIWTIEQREE